MRCSLSRPRSEDREHDYENYRGSRAIDVRRFRFRGRQIAERDIRFGHHLGLRHSQHRFSDDGRAHRGILRMPLPARTAKRCCTSAPHPVAFGNPPMAAPHSSPCSTRRACSRSARSPSIRNTTTRSGPAAAKAGLAIRFPSATASTNRPTAASRGRIWVCRIPSGSPRSLLIPAREHDTVYACVPGHLWNDSPDRGLYKTTDGGAHWAQVLKGANLSTGCASVSLDPKDSGVVFASLWDFRRKGWTFRSGGESPTSPSASGLYRSADGGKTWNEVTDAANKGFPKKPFRTYSRLDRAVEREHRLRVRRIERVRTIPLRRRRQNLGQASTRASSWSGVRFILRISSSIRRIRNGCSSRI